MNKVQNAYLELHTAVLLFGLTAILGDLIQLSALVLVWWRVLITSISLFFLIRFGRRLREIPRGLILRYMGIGLLVALHWICFFGSIKYSNASVCLVCMATTSFFTSLLEPLLNRQPVKWFEITLGLLIIPGMVLVVNSLEGGMLLGVLVGLLSALLASLFAIFNKQLVDKADSLSITFLELGSGWLLISLILPFYYSQNPDALFWPSSSDFGYLMVLALLCTTLAYVLALRALKYLSAFAANLTVNLEPVYGIVLAWLLLNENEELNASFYWGCLIIIGTVLSYPFLKKRFEKNIQTNGL
ncbi:MAG: EamA family transporter [Bacteroidota bacterium]